MGWTLAQWAALTDNEKRIWMARELHVNSELKSLTESFQEKRPRQQNRQDNNTNAWTPEVAALMLLRRIYG